MRRAHIFALVGGLTLLAAGSALMQLGPPMHTRELLIDGGTACPAAPVRVLESGDPGPVHGSLVVFHGLSANRWVMLPLGRQFASAGFRVFLVDSPGHGANPAPFTFATNEACARGVLAHLQRAGEIVPKQTVLLGHSMGGGLVIRLADDFVAAGTIAIAAAPIVRPHRMPENLQLVAPQFDMPPILEQEREIAATAGAAREAPEDFRQSRAFRVLRVPWNSHTSPLFSAPATMAMIRWALNAVGAFSAPVPPIDYRAFRGALLGLAGILLMFPVATELCATLIRLRSPSPDPGTSNARMALLAWTIAGVLAAVILPFWMPMARVKLFGGDYLASFLLLAGIPLAMAFCRAGFNGPMRPGMTLASLVASAVVATATIAAVGAWSNLQLAEVWPIPARWARIPLLAAVMLPACLAEEWALGPVGPSSLKGGVLRLLEYLSLRGIFWCVMLAAYLSGAGAALLPVIFAAPLAGVSLGARIGADLLRRRTGSAAGAAVFNAILMAWFVAAAFPLA